MTQISKNCNIPLSYEKKRTKDPKRIKYRKKYNKKPEVIERRIQRSKTDKYVKNRKRYRAKQYKENPSLRTFQK